MRCDVRIETEDASRSREARTAASRFGLCTTQAESNVGDALILAMRDDGWELRDASMRPGRGLCIDFTALAKRSPRRVNLSRRQPLLRAVGRESRSVIDATAGLGHDAALLAAMGLNVTAIERSAILALMLEEALQRADADERAARLLGDRLRIVHGDARTLLTSGGLKADCIYLDPMFPPKRRTSALAGKEIRLVRALVGDDDDAADLLAIARRCAPRVAVKRPRHAQPLATDVHATIKGTLMRYDIYMSGEASTSSG